LIEWFILTPLNTFIEKERRLSLPEGKKVNQRRNPQGKETLRRGHSTSKELELLALTLRRRITNPGSRRNFLKREHRTFFKSWRKGFAGHEGRPPRH